MRSVLAMSALAIVFAAPIQSRPAREGIVVHGSWTIDIRQPDGRLVSHRQFENGLSGGVEVLQLLLLNKIAPGGWMIGIGTAEASPCRRPLDGATASCLIIQADNPRMDNWPYANISKTLSANVGPTTFSNSIWLSGTTTAESSATFNQVQTALFACSPTITPEACPTSTNGNANSFTRAVLPQGISVVAGQIIQVTVKISFTSPAETSTAH